MADVFISYARENQAFAQRVAEGVKREGYSVWWDDDLPPHLSYGDVITEKIGGAKAAIVIWSKESAASEWVRAEADVAREQKKLIQTSIDERQPPMPFNQIQFASIADWNGERDHPGWKKVRLSLAALCAPAVGGPEISRAAATAAPAPPAVSPARGNKWLIPVLAGALGVAVIAGAGWMLLRDPAPAEPQVSPPAPAPIASSPASSSPVQGPQPATARFTHAAVIQDPDGFTNVRSGPSSGFPVIARIEAGQVFTTYPQTQDWWQVRTADSRVGFMESSRIRIVDAGAAAPAAAPDAVAGLDPAAVPAASAPSVHRPGGQIFPDSSERLLTRQEVQGLSPAQARIARNEIFARHGRIFRDPALRQHFARQPWYRPRLGPVVLSRVEQANVALLQRAERK